MAFLDSDKITMFPSAGRNPSADPTSRLTTEYNLVNIVNRLLTTNKDGFVITSTFSAGNPFEFCIKGYYFKIDRGDSITGIGDGIFNNSTEIYAYVNITSPTGSDEFSELSHISNQNSAETYPLDTNDGFVGVAFTDTLPALSDGMYDLLILSRSDASESWSIPKESQVRYMIESPMGKTVTLKINDGKLETTTEPETTPL